MKEFKKGQIVYVSDARENWFITHFVEKETDYKTSNHKNRALNGEYSSSWRYCLSVEDYEKMLSEPADKQLCWCWENRITHSRHARFYDKKEKCAYSSSGNRNGYPYDNYEPIKREDYPQWAIEAEQTLED